MFWHLHHHPTAKSWGIKKGQILDHPTAYNVLASAPSPYGEILGHQKRSNFGSPYCVQCFGICTITLRRNLGASKKVKFWLTLLRTMFWHLHHHPTAKSWGIKKGQILAHPTAYNVLASAPSPYGEILGHQKRSNFGSPYCIQCFGICTITLRRNLGASKKVKFWLTLRRKKSKFGKILGHQKGQLLPSKWSIFACIYNVL